MPLDKLFRKELVSELRRVENMMKNEENIEKKIYYFSAAFGITGRTYRFRFSPDVLLADFVLNQTYAMLKDRINRIKSGDQTTPVEKEHFDKICDGLRLLADRFEKEENIQEPLEMILTVAFSTTGPGNYLKEKNELEI